MVVAAVAVVVKKILVLERVIAPIHREK